MATQVVSVMFTDLVGSTALLSDVGEEAADSLRREHFSLLRAAVAPSSGTEVKNLGDGLMFVFASAADAVSAAVAVQRSVARRNRRATRPLLVRVGVSLGDADVDAGDYFGAPVVEAARLCARAEGGEILAADVVRLLTGTRGGFTFEPLGELELKGLGRLVSTWRVPWARDEDEVERPPVSPRLASAVSPSFVGRGQELERLMHAWKAMMQGEHRLVLLGGEPGIGKSALAAHVATDVYRDGAIVVYGRCDEELGIPYQPWIESIGQLVAHAPREVLAEHIAEHGGSLARLVPGLAKRIPVETPEAVDPEMERYVLFGCITDLLARVSLDAPVLIVLDDLHWADRPSIQLLRHVATADLGLRGGLIGTFRDSEIGAAHPMADLLSAVHREPGVTRIPLGGLTDRDLLCFLERLAGHEMAEDGLALRDAVIAETAGNPFFIGEILRHLIDTGAIYQRDDGRWAASPDLRAAGLPVSVKEVIGRRLTWIGTDTERVLALAAVIGREFEVSLLAAVARMDEDGIVDLCDAAVRAAILRTTEDTDRYTFAHALIEHALYDGLSPARRARTHRAVAELLEERLGPDPGERAGELAYHWGAAVVPTDVAKATHFAVVAARRALDQLAPDAALRWYSDALELLDRGHRDDRLRAEILVGLGDAQRQCGVSSYRDTLLEAARLAEEIGAVDILVKAALTNSRGWQSVVGGADEQRLAVIHRALDRLEGDEDGDRARLLALAAIESIYTQPLETRLALGEQAIESARRSGNAAALAEALRSAAHSALVPWTLERRRTWLDEAASVCDDVTDPAAGYAIALQQAFAALERGDRPAARRHRARYEAIAQRLPHTALQWSRALSEVVHLLLDGDLDAAERQAHAAFAYASEHGELDPMAVFGAQLINIRQFQGRLGEMVPLLEQLVSSPTGLPVYRAVLAAASAIEGDVTRASVLLEEDRAGGFMMPSNHSWAPAHVLWADAAARVGDAATAAVMRERLAPFSSQLASPTVTLTPVVAHYLGALDRLVGDVDAGDLHYAEAMRFHERLESPLLVASTQAAWAALLADGNRPDDIARARPLAEAAAATAAVSGYGYIQRHADTVLDRLRGAG